MKILNKIPNRKILLRVFFLEFIFLVIVFITSKFFINKIYAVIILLQSIQGNFEQIQNFDLNNATLEEINLVRGMLGQTSGSINQLIFYLISFVLLIFIVYVIIQSLEWNMLYNGKISNFKKYIIRFLIISAIFFIVFGIILFNILKYVRMFLIKYMFEGNFEKGIFIKLILLILITVFISHLIFTGYVYANKYTLLKSIREIFKFKKFYLFFLFIGVFVFIGLIIKYGLSISPSIYGIVILGVSVSIISTLYKQYFTNKLKE